MSSYETLPGAQPVRIDTFRRMRKRYKHGAPLGEEPRLYGDFFTNTTPPATQQTAR